VSAAACSGWRPSRRQTTNPNAGSGDVRKTPVSPRDILATVSQLLGIDPRTLRDFATWLDATGLPI
jgi:hypothetical protein